MENTMQSIKNMATATINALEGSISLAETQQRLLQVSALGKADKAEYIANYHKLEAAKNKLRKAIAELKAV